jgi:hypothetical protein
MLEYNRPQELPPKAEFLPTDLNDRWPLCNEASDFGFALEVIEHLENPRHFMREFTQHTDLHE